MATVMAALVLLAAYCALPANAVVGLRAEAEQRPQRLMPEQVALGSARNSISGSDAWDEVVLLQLDARSSRASGDSRGQLGVEAARDAAAAIWPTRPNSAVPMVSLFAAVAVGMLLLRSSVAASTVQEAARTCYIVVNVCFVLSMSIVIVDSYSLCKAFGLSTADSGQMVGEYFLGQCLGSLAAWFLALRVHKLWQRGTRQVMFAGICCQLLGALLYTWMAMRASRIVKDRPVLGEDELVHSAMILMGGRLLSGFGAGSAQQCYISAMLHITPTEVRPRHSTRWILSTMLSFGIGPMLAAVVEVKMTPEVPSFEHVGHVQLILAACMLYTVCVLHPSLEGVADCAADEVDETAWSATAHASPEVFSEASSGALDRLCRKRTVMVGCLLMTALRAYATTASEVVIVQVMEARCGWSHSAIGVTIGAIFLLLVPLKICHEKTGSGSSTLAWIRVLSLLAVVGSLMLLERPAQWLEEVLHVPRSWEFIVAASVFLPTLSLGDALSLGIMHQHILPHGSLLDTNHTNLWYNIIVGLARFLGPWCGRAFLSWSYTAFVWQHIAVLLAFVVVFEAMVAPFVLTFEEGGKDGYIEDGVCSTCSTS